MICLNSVNIRSKICKRFLDSDKVSLRWENWAKIFHVILPKNVIKSSVSIVQCICKVVWKIFVATFFCYSVTDNECLKIHYEGCHSHFFLGAVKESSPYFIVRWGFHQLFFFGVEVLWQHTISTTENQVKLRYFMQWF